MIGDDDRNRMEYGAWKDDYLLGCMVGMEDSGRIRRLDASPVLEDSISPASSAIIRWSRYQWSGMMICAMAYVRWSLVEVELIDRIGVLVDIVGADHVERNSST